MKKRYCIEPKSPLILTAAAFLGISFALRLFWSIHWHVNDLFILLSQVVLPLFSLPLAFHIFIEDLIINRDTHTAAAWIQEISVLCIMAALLCISLAMKEVPRNQKEVC